MAGGRRQEVEGRCGRQEAEAAVATLAFVCYSSALCSESSLSHWQQIRFAASMCHNRLHNASPHCCHATHFGLQLRIKCTNLMVIDNMQRTKQGEGRRKREGKGGRYISR